MFVTLATRVALATAAASVAAGVGLLSGHLSDAPSMNAYCVDDQHRVQDTVDPCNGEVHGYNLFPTHGSFPVGVTVTEADGTFISPSDEVGRKRAGLPPIGPLQDRNPA